MVAQVVVLPGLIQAAVQHMDWDHQVKETTVDRQLQEMLGLAVVAVVLQALEQRQ